MTKSRNNCGCAARKVLRTSDGDTFSSRVTVDECWRIERWHWHAQQLRHRRRARAGRMPRYAAWSCRVYWGCWGPSRPRGLARGWWSDDGVLDLDPRLEIERFGGILDRCGRSAGIGCIRGLLRRTWYYVSRVSRFLRRERSLHCRGSGGRAGRRPDSL